MEFKHKRHAKACVDGINGRIVGGKKGGWYRDDVWNAKYLRRFRWDDLMAGVRQEEREREEKVRVGIAKDKREREAFVQSLESAKVEETQERKRQRIARSADDAHDENGAHEERSASTSRRQHDRSFTQRTVHHPESKASLPGQTAKVLSKIF